MFDFVARSADNGAFSAAVAVRAMNALPLPLLPTLPLTGAEGVCGMEQDWGG